MSRVKREMTEAEIQAEALRRLKEDYRRTFLASSHGQRVLKDLLDFCGVFDGHHDLRAEGRRDVGLTLLNALDKRSYQGLLDLQQYGLGLTDLEKGD